MNFIENKHKIHRNLILELINNLVNSNINCYENKFLPYLKHYKPSKNFWKHNKILSIESLNYLKLKIKNEENQIDDLDMHIFKERYLDEYKIINTPTQTVSTFITNTTLLSPTIKKILSLKFLGNTLQEIGDEFNLTRERIRQLIDKAIKIKFPILIESEYLNLFNKYDMSFKIFNKITNLNISSYYYLKWISDSKISTKLPSIKLIDDFNFDEEVKDFIKLENRFSTINGEMIEQKVLNFLEIILKENKRKMKWSEIEEIYNNKFFGKHINKKPTRGLQDRLAKSNNVLASINFNYRYYDISLISNQTLDNLKKIYMTLEPGSYSTNYIFQNNLNLMNELQVLDKYELHNLSKKLFHNIENLKFTRMPNFLVEYKDKLSFYINILKKFPKISLNDFVHFLASRYGHDLVSLKANILNDLDEYCKDGYLSLEYKK